MHPDQGRDAVEGVGCKARPLVGAQVHQEKWMKAEIMGGCCTLRGVCSCKYDANVEQLLCSWVEHHTSGTSGRDEGVEQGESRRCRCDESTNASYIYIYRIPLKGI